ncbi:MAG TPA: hypothetical protein VKB50_29495 [Vicinamibacterales bacterium]|nr:hypothetical protein [Vicinamibacterales bacterium]
MSTPTAAAFRLTLLAIAALGWSPVFAADRLTDRDVKALVERIDEGRKRFEDALDDKLKDDIVRTPTGEVDVKRYLDDFEENIERLKARLKPDYAASAEAAAVLRQGSAIEAFFRAQPPGTRGESEWNRLATDLQALARAYGAEFPLGEHTAVRRIGDRELAGAVDSVAQTADRLKGSLDSDLKKGAPADQPTREAAVRDADQLSKDARALRDRVKDGKPSSAEADRLLAQASKMHAFIGSHQLPMSAGLWSEVPMRLQSIATAYGTSWSGSR